MKVAVIHDWLVTYAGAERVLEQILQLYPSADLFSIVDFLPDEERKFLGGRLPCTSFIQWLPFAAKRYRKYLALMPYAVRRFDLCGYDLVISSSHAVAKGAMTSKSQLHICYCHTPMRYAWDLRDQYLKESGLDRGLKGILAKLLLSHLRDWDEAASNRVDHFIANSSYVADRIRRAYARDSVVIYPPVDVGAFYVGRGREDFYVTVSRMVPYKKVDLIAEAFTAMKDRRLVIIGDGPDMEKIRAKAGRNVELLGYQPFEVVGEYMRKARAFVFAAEEDFGIAPVEAQACGTPVIAYGKGGVLETIIEGETGIFFHEQTVESLTDAIQKFEKRAEGFDTMRIREHSLQFGKERFKKEFKELVDKVVRL
jgi:glycosyltransferase involved in cell wall biosynthesis